MVLKGTSETRRALIKHLLCARSCVQASCALPLEWGLERPTPPWGSSPLPPNTHFLQLLHSSFPLGHGHSDSRVSLAAQGAGSRACLWLLHCSRCWDHCHLGAGHGGPSSLASLPGAVWLHQGLASEALQRNPHSRCYPWHFQELKLNGEELVFPNPQLCMCLGNSLLRLLRLSGLVSPGLQGRNVIGPGSGSFGLNWHKLVNGMWITGASGLSGPERGLWTREGMWRVWPIRCRVTQSKGVCWIALWSPRRTLALWNLYLFVSGAMPDRQQIQSRCILQPCLNDSEYAPASLQAESSGMVFQW